MESWRLVWRDGFVPAAKNLGLWDGVVALAAAVEADSKELVQGSTTTPPPLMCVQDWPVESADAVAYVGWKGGKVPSDSVGKVEVHFATLCYEADKLLGEPASCRWFLNFWDDTPRKDLLPLFLAEVRFNLACESGCVPANDPISDPAGPVARDWKPGPGCGDQTPIVCPF